MNKKSTDSESRTEKESTYYPDQPIYNIEIKRDFQTTFDKERNVIRIRELENTIEHNFVESFLLIFILFVHVSIIVMMFAYQLEFEIDKYSFDYFLTSAIVNLLISGMGLASLRSRQITVHQVFIFLLLTSMVNLIILFMKTTKFSNTIYSTVVLGILVAYIVTLFFSFRTVGILKRMQQLSNMKDYKQRLLMA